MHIDLRIDGVLHSAAVDARTTLADHLREVAGCTEVHVGCEHGVCGACTVLVDEAPVRSCLMLAVQADGRDVTTAAGLERLDPTCTGALRSAFETEHAVQCGFCTPGMLLVARTALRDDVCSDATAVRDAIHGNLCRCTGYQQIVEAILAAGTMLEESGREDGEVTR